MQSGSTHAVVPTAARGKVSVPDRIFVISDSEQPMLATADHEISEPVSRRGHS
jgi:hypothetical protein